MYLHCLNFAFSWNSAMPRHHPMISLAWELYTVAINTRGAACVYEKIREIPVYSFLYFIAYGRLLYNSDRVCLKTCSMHICSTGMNTYVISWTAYLTFNPKKSLFKSRLGSWLLMPPPYYFGHRRSHGVRRRRLHSPRRLHFSFTAPIAGWSRHARRY